ncbi:MAG: NADH-quinone oxidoreductase subunit J [Actinomycetota bacterium]|nr:NADH-quinone oxidoreductase subunit J [Actinomycetota bacterium]
MVPLLLTAIAKPDLIVFLAAALVVVAGGIGVISYRNPVHSALSLVMTMFGIATLFIEQNAQFLAAVQIIVYAGAIVVLFLFVIMLLGVDRAEVFSRERIRAQRPLAAVAGVVTLGEILILAHATWATGAKAANGPIGNSSDNVFKIAQVVFSTYLLPFEATAILLVIAVLSAVYLSKRVVVNVDEALEAPEDEVSLFAAEETEKRAPKEQSSKNDDEVYEV